MWRASRADPLHLLLNTLNTGIRSSQLCARKFIQNPLFLIGAWLKINLVILAIFLIRPVIVQAGFPSPGVLSNQPIDQGDCPVILGWAMDNLDLFDKLLNPKFSDLEEINQSQSEITRLSFCLDQLPANRLTEEFKRLKILAQYFLIFVGNQESSSSRNELVDLTTSTDSAVRLFRDQIGIPEPEGYIYIHYYGSRESMPELIRAAFNDPQVAGVTILSRYIAVLEEKTGSWAEQALQRQALPATISHELIHAYINSYLAERNALLSSDLPKWFEEGLASYISHSDRPHTLITPTLTLNQTATQEYQEYTLYFKYLEDRLGKDQLFENIRNALVAGKADQLYLGTGIPDDRWLAASAESWQRNKVQRNYYFGLLMIVALITGLYLSLPEFECDCGFTGRKKDFAHGICPECGNPVTIARKYSGGSVLAKIIPDCQVCRRRFWPSQRKQIDIHPHLVRVWSENPLHNNRPLPHHVHRVCHSCLALSQSLVDEYRENLASLINQADAIYRPVFAQWLSIAPLFPAPQATNLKLPHQIALDLILQAAFEPAYGDWLEEKPGIIFSEPFSLVQDESGIVLPPVQYRNVLADPSNSRSGSVYLDTDGSVIFTWETR
jgi:hypothetical protein